MKGFKRAVLVAALAMLPAWANAASVLDGTNYEVAQNEFLSSATSTLTFVDGSTGFSVFSATQGVTVSLTAPPAFLVNVLSTPSAFGLDFDDDGFGPGGNTLFKQGGPTAPFGATDLALIMNAQGGAVDTIEFLFEGVTAGGAFSPRLDGGALLVTVSADGADFTSASVDVNNATIRIDSLQVIPLPAGGLLLLTGAGALAFVARRRRS